MIYLQQPGATWLSTLSVRAVTPSANALCMFIHCYIYVQIILITIKFSGPFYEQVRLLTDPATPLNQQKNKRRKIEISKIGAEIVYHSLGKRSSSPKEKIFKLCCEYKCSIMARVQNVTETQNHQ